MRKHKSNLILVLILIAILSSMVYAEVEVQELKVETIFEENSEDEIIVTPFNLVINEPYLSQSNGRYSDEVFSVARNMDIYFDNTSGVDVDITVENVDRPQITETYTVAAGTNPTKRYRNIKAGEHYIIRLRTVDGSRLTGELRVRTYN